MHPLDCKLVLASQSPRRRELLTTAGFSFTVRVAGIDERRQPGESPEGYVRRLARMKVEAIALAPDEIGLGADTTVVVGEHLLEKPIDDGDAIRMLRLLSGRAHRVVTGIALRHAGKVLSDCEATIVVFNSLSEAEITAYVASGEPVDKAGAYAIQGLASKFIARIDGCYSNVVGLPVALVYHRVKELVGSLNDGQVEPQSAIPHDS
ncbi:MAG: septum formation inhibitor Maf [Bryobacterales bacterium]|nr:septum formation inhibitor Maf [Bryobacterales bacterium]